MRRPVLAAGGFALLTVVAGSTVAAGANAGTVTYEAEAPSNRMTGGARTVLCQRCSDDARVTGLGGTGVLTFANVIVKQDGPVRVSVTYTAEGNRTARISINGALPTAIDFPGTRGSARPADLTITMTLRNGVNSIRFENPTGAAPDLDKIVLAIDGPPPAATPSVAASQADPVTEVVRLVNDERRRAGCDPVTENDRLTAAARRHAADMASHRYFGHVSPAGDDFANRLRDVGYHWSGAGENLAKGQDSAAAVMASWMASDGHRGNILNCDLHDIGVAVAAGSDGELLWTQDLAGPA